MNNSLQIALAASAVMWMAASLSGKAKNEIALGQGVSIHLYNDAEVNPGTLHWATVEVDRLFRAAGIQISWYRSSGKAEHMDRTGSPCAAFNQPRDIVMRLIPKAPATVSSVALGLARPFTREGTQILIFWERLEVLTRSMTLQDYTILGHVMAHEIGHVLLHSTVHSTGGVMQTRWTGMSWHLASEGLLAFSSEEIERMNAGLTKSLNNARNVRAGITCPGVYQKTQP